MTADSDACDYILYYAASAAAKTLGRDNQVTKQWYAQNENYDFKLHKNKVDSNDKSIGDSEKFERMMWAKSIKVGFGYAL